MNRSVYENPLVTRYASREMLRLFSPDFKFRTWRKLWIALAEAERSLGLPVTAAQISEMKRFRDRINYAEAEKQERKTRHDVMAHVLAYGKQCKKAARIIHLGATSAYVGDNTDLVQMKEGLSLVRSGLLRLISGLAAFAGRTRALPCLAYTHFQPAQLTTVGKRACLWIQDFVQDLSDLEHQLAGLRFLGVKGTTGTQASFLHLFRGSHARVKRLDAMVTKKMGFKGTYPVTGQTYPRKVDARILSVLSGIAQSIHKMTGDIRLLQGLKELEEPFEKHQIGSSAMAYKRNPMRCERAASLSRFIMALSASAANTAATQWFERTLDDSANKRLAVAEAFLAADAALLIMGNIAQGLVVYPRMIERRIRQELPFMATENILMEAVRRGGDRQALHEKIRRYSMRAGDNVKRLGRENNLLELIASDGAFRLDSAALSRVLSPAKYTGRAKEQVSEFLSGEIRPLLRRRMKLVLQQDADLKI